MTSRESPSAARRIRARTSPLLQSAWLRLGVALAATGLLMAALAGVMA